MSALELDRLEDFRLVVFLKERFNFGVEVGTEDAQGGGIVIGWAVRLMGIWVIGGRWCVCLLHCERLCCMNGQSIQKERGN